MGTTPKMREFTAGDVFEFVNILSLVKGSDIKNLISTSAGNSESETAEDRGIAIVAYILNTVYRDCADKVIDWFASLYNMGRKDFLAQPPSLVLDTIETLATSKGAKDFFLQASTLFKRISGFGNTTKSE
jgi:hypothetical protein